MDEKNNKIAERAEEETWQKSKAVNEQRFLTLLQLVKQQDYPSYLAEVAILLCAVGEQTSNPVICSCFETAGKRDLTMAIRRIKERQQAYSDAGALDKAAALIREYWRRKETCIYSASCFTCPLPGCKQTMSNCIRLNPLK